MLRSPGRPPLSPDVLPLPVMRPNEPLVGLITGTSRLTRFGKLNVSMRNCARNPAGGPKFFNSARSQLWYPGPRTGLRPALPNVPAAGRANAAGLNQNTWSTLDPAENPGLDTDGSPTRFHGWLVVSPTPARSSFSQIDSGRPDWNTVAPETCHPPSAFEASVFCSRQNGSS